MGFVERLRADLARAGSPVGRAELPFLLVGMAAVIVAAQLSEPGTSAGVVLLVLAGAALVTPAMVGRTRWELVAVAVIGPVSLAVGQRGALELAWFLVVTMTLYAAWHIGSTVRACAIAAASSVAIVAVAVVHVDAYSPMPWITAECFTLALGRVLFHQRVLIAELEAAREALAEQAVAEERRRIARELHDLAGHTLAAMLLHVTGARHVLRRDTGEAERALRDAETVGRASMDQIRATVAALRTTERGTDPALADAGGLDHLLGEYRRAGLMIDASIAPEIHRLSGPVGFALHRISREALANIARHAPTNQVSVVASCDAAAATVRLEVADHGRPAAPADGTGFGLIGMRERARALGGVVVAGTSEDGWRVEAVLPMHGVERPEAAPR